jgi:hypothetical protein
MKNHPRAFLILFAILIVETTTLIRADSSEIESVRKKSINKSNLTESIGSNNFF